MGSLVIIVRQPTRELDRSSQPRLVNLGLHPSRWPGSKSVPPAEISVAEQPGGAMGPPPAPGSKSELGSQGEEQLTSALRKLQD